MAAQGKKAFDGFLSTNDQWLGAAMKANGKGSLAEYICTGSF